MANRFALFVEEEECVPHVVDVPVSRKPVVAVAACAGAGVAIPDDGWDVACHNPHKRTNNRKRVKAPGFPGKPYVMRASLPATVAIAPTEVKSQEATVSAPTVPAVSIKDFHDVAKEATDLAMTLAETFAEMNAFLDVGVPHPEAITILASLVSTREQLLACAEVLQEASKKLIA